MQPLGLLAAAASRASRRPRAWGRLPAQGLPELRGYLADEPGGGLAASAARALTGMRSAWPEHFPAECGAGRQGQLGKERTT